MSKEMLPLTECSNWCITQEIGVEIISLTFSGNAYPGNDFVDFKCSLLIQDDLFSKIWLSSLCTNMR